MPKRPESLEAAIGPIIDYVPEVMARPLVDGMGYARIGSGPHLGKSLDHSIPEERTWPDMIAPALLSITDRLDGIWGRRIGATDGGREIDRRGDRGFVMPQQKALAENGEIPPVHYTIKVWRERAMAGLRLWGAMNDKDLSSREVNRQKTAIEMSYVTGAHSPFSKSEDLMRWGSSMGSALSLTGLIETTIDYLQNNGSEKTDTARNSAARKISAGPRDRISVLIDQKAPGVTPSHLTKWGKRLVEAGSALAIARPNRPAVATTLYTVGSLLDTLDGSLARQKGEDGAEGMVEDVQADLEQQIVALAALSVIARRRGNKVAAANFAAATMTMPLSALSRAQAESQGFIVAEGGIGTRVGRAILGGIGMGFNKHRDVSDIVSATLVSSTANTVNERRSVIKHGTDSRYCKGVKDDEQFMAEGAIREEAILPYAKAGIVIGSLLLAESGIDSLRQRVAG